MKKTELKSFASLTAIALLSIAAPAYAQDQAAAADEATEEEYEGLDAIVVTASGRDQTQLETSVSVTSINADLIENFRPSSEAEVFKLLPGIQVPGTSGPGGNSNIAVRGLPVATGGAPTVAELRDAQGRVVYGWTIAPPKRSIGPKGSIEFNSAEVDVPKGARELNLSFSGA